MQNFYIFGCRSATAADNSHALLHNGGNLTGKFIGRYVKYRPAVYRLRQSGIRFEYYRNGSAF